MNIKILDSWLREFVKTNATPAQIAEKLSLSSVSVERIEKFKDDYVYDIEITTNRVDLMSLVGLARETAAVLSHNGISAKFTPPNFPNFPNLPNTSESIAIHNDPSLVNRVAAVVMEVTVKQSPPHIKSRLESTDIRSLNNLIDITNYVMRVTGHPTHVFDFDRLNTKTLTIRESKPGEEIVTLDKKTLKLPGGDVVAENDKGEIVDLLGVMGLENSVVTASTKRILFFIDNVVPHRIRKTSMSLALRSEAAVINEKGVDPELMTEALHLGIKLFEALADGKIISEIVDIYPNKPKIKICTVLEEQINKVIGVTIPVKNSVKILESLDFSVILGSEATPESQTNTTKRNSGQARMTKLEVTPPSFRANDIQIPEDLIEEIARIYGYHNIPNSLPPFTAAEPYLLGKNQFYWENLTKNLLKDWGFTEVYTYPMVSEDMYEGPLDTAVTIQNPLSDDMVYMRRTLVPSLLKVINGNKNHETIKIFEIANVYHKRQHDLPHELLRLAGVIKKPHVSFHEAKGIIEQLLTAMGIGHTVFKPHERGGEGTSIYLDLSRHSGEEQNDDSRIRKERDSGQARMTYLGDIEILSDNLLNFELDFVVLLQLATLQKTYKPVSKFPPVVEDLAIIADVTVSTGDLMETIKKQHTLITDVSLLDKYHDTRTFHIIYQSYQKNLTDEEVGEIRKKILKVLKEKFNARLKE